MVAKPRRRPGGFTLVELMVVMAVLGLLATLVIPRYFQSVDRAREAVLRSNLVEVRAALDKYFSDTGHYPENLGRLVEERYLRHVPVDPVTTRADSWLLISSPDPALKGVYDVRSGAQGQASDGTEFANW